MNEMIFVFLLCKLQNICCTEEAFIDAGLSQHFTNFVLLIAGRCCDSAYVRRLTRARRVLVVARYNSFSSQNLLSNSRARTVIYSLGRGQLKCDGTRAETRFRLSARRTMPFKSAGALV
jgi:hypothetical protein